MVADADLGPWAPLVPAELPALLDGADVTWWLMGGHALDRFVGRETRPHGDVDVEVPRPALAAVMAQLAGWDPHTAHDGVLVPLARAVDQPAVASGVWWRRRPDGPWLVDMQLAEVDGDDWVYRRHPAIRRPLASVWWRDGDGLPIVAPEVQLLFKARAERAKDAADAEVVVPELDEAARRWLREAVAIAHPGSPWRAWL